MTQKRDKTRAKKRPDPPSLHPVPFEEAVRDILEVKPKTPKPRPRKGQTKKG